MNAVVSLPIATAVPTVVPTMTSELPDRRALEAYAAWLHMERRILCHELWPHLGSNADKFVWADNAGFDWHFSGRGRLAWNEGQQPSDRAAAVLDLAGVNWRSRKENLGLNHDDNGGRPELPAHWPSIDGALDHASTNIVTIELAIRGMPDDFPEEKMNGIFDERDGHIKTLIETPAISWSGLTAKAVALKAIDDVMDDGFKPIAMSLVKDLLQMLSAPSAPA